MKNIIKITLIVIVCVFVLALVKDFAVRSVVTLAASQITGAKVDIKWMTVGIFRHSVHIYGFKMHNPKGFPEGTLVDLPKLIVDYSLVDLFKGKLHLSRLDIELKEIGLIKNKEGKLNVDSLKIAQKDSDAADKGPAKQMPMQIDLMNLQMGRIVSKDYSVPNPPSIAVYDINLKKTYKNITSAQQLAALILTEPMKQAGIKGAGIYGVAMLTGIGFVPIAIAATFGSKDHVEKELKIPMDKLYDVSLKVLKGMGKVNKEDKTAGTIVADVSGAGVTLRLKKVSDKTSLVNITARKLAMPKPEIANGVLYNITERLK